MIARLLALLSVVVLAGCSAFGGETFQCPAQMDGSTCMSAREVYGQTHVADRVAPNYKDGKPIKPTHDPSAGAALRADGATGMDARGVSVAARDDYRPPLPEVDMPLPVRVPAKVMRIRIFPWEDSARDLNAGSVVFTEVEGRMWTLGEDQVSRVQANVTNPLAPPKGAAQSTSSATTYQSPLSAPIAPRQAAPAPRPDQRPGQGASSLPANLPN